LRDGFTVVDDTELIGTLWSPLDRSRGRPQPTEYWSAVLSLGGDPIEVHNAYIDQALEREYEIVRRSHYCSVSYRNDDHSPAYDLPVGTEPPVEAKRNVVACAFAAMRALSDGTVATFSVDAVHQVGNPPLVHIDHATWAPGTQDPPPAATSGYRYEPLPDRPWLQPSNPLRIPVEGERVDDTTGDSFGDYEEPLVVAEGSRALAPVMPSRSGNGGYEVIIEITGDTADVLADYASQMRRWELEFESETYRALDHEVRSLFGSGAGAGQVELIAVIGQGAEPTYLRITRGRD
jgi:hypothetical protein